MCDTGSAPVFFSLITYQYAFFIWANTSSTLGVSLVSSVGRLFASLRLCCCINGVSHTHTLTITHSHKHTHTLLQPLSLWFFPRWCRAAHKAIWGVGLNLCVCVCVILKWNFMYRIHKTFWKHLQTESLPAADPDLRDWPGHAMNVKISRKVNQMLTVSRFFFFAFSLIFCLFIYVHDCRRWFSSKIQHSIWSPGKTWKRGSTTKRCLDTCVKKTVIKVEVLIQLIDSS